MEDNTLSLDIENLKRFIKQNNKSDNPLIKYKVDIEQYQYNKIITCLDKSAPVEYLESRCIMFENNDMVINFYFDDETIIDIIDQYISSNINFSNLIQNKNIRCEVILSHILIKDIIFNVYILEKTTNDKIVEKTRYSYDFKQIVRYHTGEYFFDIVIINNNQFHIEFNIEYDKLDVSIKPTLEKIIYLLHGENIIIENDLLISKYKQLTRTDRSVLLQTKSPHNMMITDLLDVIDNTYVVFDKTDGERVHLMLLNGKFIYFNLIFNCYLAGAIDDSVKDVLIFDCERYKNKFYIFDLVFSSLYDSKDHIDSLSIFEKIAHVNEFITKMKTSFPNNKFVNNDLVIKKPLEYLLTDTKEMFFAKVSKLFKEIEKSDIDNDGLIFQSSLSNKVMREKKILDYRWKPRTKATVDCYIKFEAESFIRTLDKTFLKISLYCFVENTSTKKEEEKFFDFSYAEVDESGLIFTKAGEVLISEIVVEFEPDFIDLSSMIQNTSNYTNTNDEENSNNTVLNSANLFSDRGYNWIPLRIRYDKTFAVSKYQRKHGNNISVAEQIKEYIDRPILFEYFELLSENFQEGYLTIQKTIMDKKVKSVAKSFDKFVFDYVQTVTLLSWAVMLSQIAPYKPIIIEIDCRKANNVYKIYSYGVVFIKQGPTYDGYNSNNIELLSNIDGAVSRYNDAKTKKPNFFEFKYHFMIFV